CPNLTVKVTGFRPDHLPDGWTFAPNEGVYKMAQTDDQNIMIVKDADGHVAAYFVTNKFNSKRSTVVRTYDEAVRVENEGAGLHYTGKAIEYTLLAVLVVGLIAVVVAGAAAGTAAQPRCWTDVYGGIHCD